MERLYYIHLDASLGKIERLWVFYIDPISYKQRERTSMQENDHQLQLGLSQNFYFTVLFFPYVQLRTLRGVIGKRVEEYGETL